MFRGFISITVLILSITIFLSFAQGSEIYFGAQGNQDSVYINMDAAHLDTMKNILGFNMYSPLGAWPDILDLMDDSLKLIPDMYETQDNILSAYGNYIYAHYAIVQAEDDTHQIRFRIIDGSDSSGFVYGPESSPGDTAIFLDSLWYKHSTSGVGPFKYGLTVNIDTVDLEYSDTLGFLRIRTGRPWVDPSEDTVATFFIVSDPFLDSSLAICYLEFELLKPPALDWIQVATFQERTFGVDYFKVSNDKGRELVDQGSYINEIVGFAESYSPHVFFWYLRDEPQFTHWKPFEIIKSALESCGSCSTGNSIFAVSVDQSPKDFLAKVDPGVMWFDNYPLFGGQKYTMETWADSQLVSSVDDSFKVTRYTGYDGPDQWWKKTPPHGLQFDLDSIYVRQFDSVYSAAADAGKDIWVTPEAFGYHYLDCWYYPGGDTSYYYDFHDGWYYRMPTQSELCVETFIAMCYGVKGIIYWRYDGRVDNNGNWPDIYTLGIVDSTWTSSYHLTDAWYAIKDKINPYLKAIGDVYMTLQQDTSYAVHFGTPNYPPPANSWIDTIYALSNSPDSNPDLGWFHVGQFTESSDKYIMLVNRACSQGPDDPTHAPSVTATVRFDPGNLGLGDYVYIIDIADSLRLAGADTGWVGIPDTTYTAKMPDGGISADGPALIGFEIVAKYNNSRSDLSLIYAAGCAGWTINRISAISLSADIKLRRCVASCRRKRGLIQVVCYWG